MCLPIQVTYLEEENKTGSKHKKKINKIDKMTLISLIPIFENTT